MTDSATAGTGRHDGDSWDLASSVGATATAVAARRAMASKGPNPLIDDPYAEPLVTAVGVDAFIRMINGEIAGDEEGLVEIGPRHRLDHGSPQGVALHRQVADIVPVEPDREFSVERLSMKPGGFAADGLDQGRRDTGRLERDGGGGAGRRPTTVGRGEAHGDR